MKKGLYRGYSSYEYQKKKTFKLTDIDLVKMDILNHVFTRKGERVMMPNFGTTIPDLAFEPLDQILLDLLNDELRTVVAFDPRVRLLELNVIPDYDRNAVVANLRLLYLELNIVDTLDINITFEGEQQ